MSIPPIVLALLLALQHPNERPVKPTAASDPFHAEESMRGIVGDDSRGADRDFMPLDNAPTMPAMRVRGIVKMKERPKPAAILEIEGIGRYTVREGERVSFSLAGRFTTSSVAPARAGGDRAAPAAGPQLTVRQQIPIVLRVETIAVDGVIVEVGTLGEKLIIR